MKIETQFLENHEARLIVEVEAERLEGMKRRAASKIAGRVKIAGFRPGKAPYAVVVRQVGEAAIMEEALELLVDAVYPEIIDEAKIKPYGPGRLDKVASTEPLTLEFVVPLEAEVLLGDYRAIRKPYEAPVVSDKDIDDVIENLRENQAVIEPVERPAQDGDLVTVRLSATRKSVEEGQPVILIREQSVPVVVKTASDEDGEWPFAGFSQHLIGMAASDEKVIDHLYDESEKSDLLRGVDAEFHVQVENVKSRNLPEVDEEFVHSLGDFDTVDALRDGVRKSLNAQASSSYNQEYDQQIMDEALQQTIFKFPPQMLAREQDEVIDDLTHRLEQQGYDIGVYLKSRNMEMDDLRKELEPVAEKRLKQSLFLFELGKAENVRVNPDELEQESKSTLAYLTRTLPEKEARKFSNQETYTNLIGNIFIDMLSRRSMERFRDICRGLVEIEQESSVEEILDQVEVEQETSVNEIEETVSENEVAGDVAGSETL